MLLSIHPLPDDLLLGLWQIEPQAGRSVRTTEREAVCQLLERMIGTKPQLEHLPNGKPTLDGWNISISHTKGYAAILLSRTHAVGIDIEYTSDRVARIASRFLRPDEHPQTTAETLACWSAKETLFKLFSEDALTFQEMRITPTDEIGKLHGENLKRSHKVEITVVQNPQFTLTYAHL